MAWYAYCITERTAYPELARHRRPMPLSGVTGLFGNQTFFFPAADLAVLSRNTFLKMRLVWSRLRRKPQPVIMPA